MAYTEEASKFDAQKNKLKSLCEEHDLVYSLNVKQYPIVLTISKATKQYQQQTLPLEEKAEVKPDIDPNAKIVWIFKATALAMKVEGGTFTIDKALRAKIEGIFLKIVNFWQQYFFRDALEKNMLKKGKFPEEPEGSEADQAADEDTEDTED